MKLNTKSIKNILMLFPLGMMTFVANAQGDNLVENGSFEAISGKLRKLGGLESATGWISPTAAKADLFVPSLKIPEIGSDNVYGGEVAKEGSNFAGIVTYSYGDKLPRTYLSTKLRIPMKKGMKYCVSFNVSLAEASKYASGNIAANFSSKPYATDQKASVIAESHILNENNKVYSGMYSWDKVCGIYTSTGGEKFITIGNFENNNNVKTEKIKKPADFKGTQIIASYYYIDDISVTLLNPGDDCGCGTPEVSEDQVANIVYQQSFVPTEGMKSNEIVESQVLYFGFGKDNLTGAAEKALDLIAEQLNKNTGLKLLIKGHNDAMEDEMAFKKSTYADMDQKRLDRVTDYLASKGISKERIVQVREGSNSENPEISSSDENDIKLAKNRRVTFKVR